MPARPAHPALGRASTPYVPPWRTAGRSHRAANRFTPRRGGGLGHITGLCFCIDIDLLLVVDTRRAPRWRESMMRHFLRSPLTPARLAARMMDPPPKRLLVASPGGPHTLPPGLARARRWAIALPMIAAPADPQLLMTERTVPHPIADDVDRTTSSPQRLDAAAQSRHCQLRDTRNCRSQRRLPEGSRRLVLGPSPFAERARVIAPATARKLSAPNSPRADEEEEANESDPRSRSIRNMVNDPGAGRRCSPDSRTSCQPFTRRTRKNGTNYRWVDFRALKGSISER